MTRPTLAILSFVLAACGAPAPAATPDAAVDDAATPPDASMVCGTLSENRLVPLPASCLPRCTAATFAAYRACTVSSCIPTALSADPTPPVLFATPGRVFVLGCGPRPGVEWTCVQWQTFAIAAALCPGNYDRWVNCAGTGAACEAEINAMMACAEADPSFETMFRDLVSMCFASP